MFENLKILWADKTLQDRLVNLRHTPNDRLRYMGAFADFVSTCWKWDKIHEPAIACGITQQNLAFLYANILFYLDPNICVKHGSRLLAPTLLFADPIALTFAINLIAAETQERGDKIPLDLLIQKHAQMIANSIKANHRTFPIA